ncbi:alpha/beta fold hydrolase [Leucobacter luti]|uniref:Pimeloyl-ACP methyl ester carboxylesterase n=1 Tax=Leucobacter luti TaxID=340320 RepID=A0A4Q7TPW6_9MICO|nr:alpha/beta hydrolase [Leucobacter luti]RZT62814.1 pimeloyl-ACP methyl ester carboxylesterase [Leucobacter luti]
MGDTEVRGARLYTEVTGLGAPLLVLHGGFCSLESLRPVAAALQADRRVYAYERPGHGRTADTATEYDYARDAGDALAFLDAHGIESAEVIGYSDGAIIGLLLARDHPERVRALVAISGNLDPSGFSGAPEAAGMPTLRDRTPEPTTEQQGTADAAAEPSAEQLHYAALSPDGPAHAEVVLDKLFRLWTTSPPIPEDSLGVITARTLVMSGDRDSIRPDHSLRIAAAIPGAQLCIVPGATHGLVTERAALVSRLAREFLLAQD